MYVYSFLFIIAFEPYYRMHEPLKGLKRQNPLRFKSLKGFESSQRIEEHLYSKTFFISKIDFTKMYKAIYLSDIYNLFLILI